MRIINPYYSSEELSRWLSRMALCALMLTAMLNNFCLAQDKRMTITGTVADSTDHAFLDHASVYLNSTTTGTNTSTSGTFSLTGITPGKYDLVVSYLGYKTRVVSVDLLSNHVDLKIEMQRDTNQLKEIVVKSGVQDKRYLNTFIKYFIGEDKNSRKCKLLNPKVLFFNYDAKTRLFTAYADKALLIRNEALGYIVHYDLDFFQYDFSTYHLMFYGHFNFDPMEARGKHMQKVWIQNRMNTYLGSMRHFMKALYDRKLMEEGFAVEKMINGIKPHAYSADSLRPDFRYPVTVPYDSIIETSTGSAPGFLKIKFTNSLLVSPFYYENHYKRNAGEMETTVVSPIISATRHKYAPSILTMTKSGTYLSPGGVLTNPMAIAIEGSWAENRVADLLPLDYVMPDQN